VNSRIEMRLYRQEQMRRHLLSFTFGIVLPILLLLAAGLAFVATFSAG
jgi:hypothetical protein